MHWKKIIPVVFFGIFLVSQLVTSPIYAQEKVSDVPESNALSSTSNALTLQLDMDSATFWALIGAIGGITGSAVYSTLEYRMARRERNLSIVEGYSTQLTELKNKERSLKTKKDCETYAQNYLDLMDQIAYLCRENRGVPKDVRDYFENDFAYALTIMWWLKENNLIKSKSIEDLFDSPDPGFKKSNNRDRAKTREIFISKKYSEYTRESAIHPKKEFDDKSFPWYDLICWCLDDKNKKLITPFDDDQLPDAMYFYEELHDEDIEGTLQVVQEYGAKLIELTKDEPTLTKVLQWETYATVYLDTLDSIAYLLLNNIIPKGVDQYFENNFSYGLTMLKWLEKEKLVESITITPTEQEKLRKRKKKMKFVRWNKIRKEVDKEYPWADLLNWCTKKNIEPYDDSYLPKKMTNPNRK